MTRRFDSDYELETTSDDFNEDATDGQDNTQDRIMHQPESKNCTHTD